MKEIYFIPLRLKIIPNPIAEYLGRFFDYYWLTCSWNGENYVYYMYAPFTDNQSGWIAWYPDYKMPHEVIQSWFEPFPARGMEYEGVIEDLEGNVLWTS